MGALVGHVRHAPGTYLWLAALGVTAVAAQRMNDDRLQAVLGSVSTNLDNLEHDPIRVLVTSAFWFDGGSWVRNAAMYVAFHATLERRVGTRRWLGVVVTSHVLATYLSQGLLALAIRNGLASPHLAHTMDFGVSYALAGAQGALTWLVPWRWGRVVYAGTLVAVYLVPFVGGVTFVDVGHLSALLIGVACRPLVVTAAQPADAQPAGGLNGAAAES